MKKHVIILFGSLFLVLSVKAQDMVVKGKVTLFNTYPVSNLSVQAKKAKSSVLTDSSGLFSISCKKKDIIQIQEKGFMTLSKNVNDESGFLNMNIVFKDSPKNREVVVARGNIKSADLIYGLANLKDENNDYCSFENIFDLIRSKFPTVEVKSSSSGGLGVYLRRGPKSMTLDTQMLYIVDGMRTTSISYINPCEIAKINILSEGASAKYGAGSSNGSIEIFTKRAKVN